MVVVADDCAEEEANADATDEEAVEAGPEACDESDEASSCC